MADLVIPEDVPWQLLCTSQDMMDPKFCNKKFPFPWRSSLAISAYEVPEAQLPIPFCNGRLTYIKLTLSVTGLGNWKVDGFVVADKVIPVKAACFYSFGFGGVLAYTIKDDMLSTEITQAGTWSFDTNNAQLVMQFNKDGQNPPNERYVCQVVQAASPTLKFTYTDVNGIISEVTLEAAP